jgi:YVTN family beta-propeller protein
MISVPVNVRSLAITPDGAFLYVTHGSPSGGGGIVYVISTSSGEVVDTIDVGLWPSGVAITRAGQRQGQAKVDICHKGKQIRVAEPAVNAHLRHGDTFPPCN